MASSNLALKAWKTISLVLYSSMRLYARLLADSMIDTGCYLKTNKGLARVAPSIAKAMVVALSGEDSVRAIRLGPGEILIVPFTAAGLFCRRAIRAPRFRLAGV